MGRVCMWHRIHISKEGTGELLPHLHSSVTRYPPLLGKVGEGDVGAGMVSHDVISCCVTGSDIIRSRDSLTLPQNYGKTMRFRVNTRETSEAVMSLPINHPEMTSQPQGPAILVSLSPPRLPKATVS